MAFEETREQQQMYNYFRRCIYVFLIIEIVMNLPITADNRITQFILDLLGRFKVFNSVAGCKMIELVCICVVCIGTKAKKALKFNVKTMVIYPVLAGLTLVGLCFIFHGVPLGMEMMGFPANRIIYAFCSIAGTMLVHQGLDGIAKYYNHKVGDDRFNFENESFQQSEKKVENPYSVNITMIYYYKRKMHNGFINLTNPFRATIVLGTPGSGKSFGIIDPFIRQHSAKGFAMMVYDYKFPTLAKTLFYQYCKNKRNGKLPNNCGFRIVNFTDVEYSNRINPIQRKYIPDLAAASETAATLLASLNKGGGEKKGGSEAFFTNSAENFLAAIIYFFVNLHPTGFKDGKKLKRFISYEGKKLEIVIRNWFDYNAIDDKGEVVLDFIDDQSRNHSIDEDGLFVDLNGYSYTRRTGETVRIDRCWYEDEHGNEVEPDTITGEYSDMPHVLSFLGHGYKEIFDILMQDAKIASLMAPFKSAFENKANDQLEGMVGTLRVKAARLVSPEAYWVFTGDDFDLKISDPENPSYLIIANDPEKEQVIGSLNALVLNCNKRLDWAWIAQTVYFTLVFHGKSRKGQELEDRFGDSLERMTAVTDRHSAYFALHFLNHQVCLAHLLRECQYLNELDKEQEWSKSVESLLQEAIHERNQRPTESIDPQSWLERLDRLIDENLSKLNEKFTTFKNGLLKCRDYIFNFLRDPVIPPDNNASERGIRKLKIKLKNSGCFRSDLGADAFMDLHSIVETTKKHGNSPYNAILALF